MDAEQEAVREKSFDVHKHLIDRVWEDAAKGLRKEVINFRYCSIVKASELSKCLIDVIHIDNLDPKVHKTNYILEENIGKEIWVDIGHSVTAVDCYIEELLKQMLTNETSKCFIKTKSSGTLAFTLRLKRIEFGGYYYEQDALKMFEIARNYKENGVKMFKEFPRFAQNYFNLAAKCLLAFGSIGEIDQVLKDTELTKSNWEDLLQNVYSNVAACLIKEKRFNEILPIMDFVNRQKSPSEKAVFRLATAYLNINRYEDAKKTIEKVDFKANKELVQLMSKIQLDWKSSNDKDKDMMKKMLFG
jgi:tetratricopeptide (TPR) repeat protein